MCWSGRIISVRNIHQVEYGLRQFNIHAESMCLLIALANELHRRGNRLTLAGASILHSQSLILIIAVDTLRQVNRQVNLLVRNQQLAAFISNLNRLCGNNFKSLAILSFGSQSCQQVSKSADSGASELHVRSSILVVCLTTLDNLIRQAPVLSPFYFVIRSRHDDVDFGVTSAGSVGIKGTLGRYQRNKHLGNLRVLCLQTDVTGQIDDNLICGSRVTILQVGLVCSNDISIAYTSSLSLVNDFNFLTSLRVNYLLVSKLKNLVLHQVSLETTSNRQVLLFILVIQLYLHVLCILRRTSGLPNQHTSQILQGSLHIAIFGRLNLTPGRKLILIEGCCVLGIQNSAIVSPVLLECCDVNLDPAMGVVVHVVLIQIKLLVEFPSTADNVLTRIECVLGSTIKVGLIVHQTESILLVATLSITWLNGRVSIEVIVG